MNMLIKLVLALSVRTKRAVLGFRRLCLYYFCGSYLMQQARLRKGQCNKCGACCGTCPHLTKDKLCSVYYNRPRWCHKDFPMDNWELQHGKVKDVCGYYWNKK